MLGHREYRRAVGWRARSVDARPRVLVEVVGLLLWFLLFTLLESAAGRDAGAATAHALTLQSAERAAHLDVELTANHWLAGHPVLGHLAVYLYRLYYVVVAVVLVGVFVRHAEVYRRVRRTMVAMTALVLPVYWAVPMSPPRFARRGVVDIVARYDFVGHASGEAGAGPHHYTAMPSLHVGWALWCAATIYATTTARWRGIVWLYPVMTTLVVLGTGNHYLFDAVGGIVVLAVGMLLTAGRIPARAKS